MMQTMEHMPSNARVWVYQANVFLSELQENRIREGLRTFLAQWTSHGSAMEAAAEVYHHRLVVIAADEQQAMASGCGIDKSVHYMQELGRESGIDFFQRTTVIYRKNDEWSEVPLHQFWAMRKAGVVDDETMILDSTVRTVGALRNALVVPFGRSWHKDMWGR